MFTIEHITKIQAAERQLKEAITLFFEERDPIAVMTLAAASHGILYPLAKREGKFGFLKDPIYIKDEHFKEYLQIVNNPQNFLKHADQDPDGTIEFRAETTVYHIFDCIVLLEQLHKESNAETRTFKLWWGLQYPNYLKEGGYKDLLSNLPSSIDPERRKMFLEVINADQS